MLSLDFPKRYRSVVIQNKELVILVKHFKYLGKSIIQKKKIPLEGGVFLSKNL